MPNRRMPRTVQLDHAGVIVRFTNAVTSKRRMAFWRTLQNLLNAQQAAWAAGAHRRPKVVDRVNGQDGRCITTKILTAEDGLYLLPSAKMVPSDWTGRIWQNEVRFSPCGEWHTDALDELRYRFDGHGITWDMGAEMSHSLRCRIVGLGFASKPNPLG